jgi:hypothetical protein
MIERKLIFIFLENFWQEIKGEFLCGGVGRGSISGGEF